MTIASQHADPGTMPMGHVPADLTPRERELGAIIRAYNDVTEQLKQSHELLTGQVARLREELAGKNRELQRRERLAALGELAAGVAHEIRNPLGGIRLFASLLRRDVGDRPDAVRVVDKIIQGAATLESIVTDILDYGRPPEAVPAGVRLDHLMAEVVELASPRIASGGVTVELDDALHACEVMTDKGMLQRAMLNLLLNAIDAASRSSAAGSVTIGLAEPARFPDADPAGVVLSIRDNGLGIAPSDLDKIFNPFFTTKDTGTGLGLAVVHQIVETLGGFVRVAATSADGTEFVLALPCRLPGKDHCVPIADTRDAGAFDGSVSERKESV